METRFEAVVMMCVNDRSIPWLVGRVLPAMIIEWKRDNISMRSAFGQNPRLIKIVDRAEELACGRDRCGDRVGGVTLHDPKSEPADFNCSRPRLVHVHHPSTVGLYHRWLGSRFRWIAVRYATRLIYIRRKIAHGLIDMVIQADDIPCRSMHARFLSFFPVVDDTSLEALGWIR